MCVVISLGSKILQLLRMCSYNKHQIVRKWGIFNASLLHNEHGHPPFLFQNDKYSVDKVWKKNYCNFRGITLKEQCDSATKENDKLNKTTTLKSRVIKM